MRRKMLTNREFMAIGEKVMSDQSELNVIITTQNAWLLVSFLQLASRHPALPAQLRTIVRDLGDQFTKAVTELHPEAEDALNMGWETVFDRSYPRH